MISLLNHIQNILNKNIYNIMKNKQAGLLLYRMNNNEFDFLLSLPTKTYIFPKPKWSIPKGGIENGESANEAALRELKEECFFGHYDDETEKLFHYIKENMIYFDTIITKFNIIKLFIAEDNRNINLSTNFNYSSNYINIVGLEHLTENSDWKWFNENELNSNIIHPIYKSLLFSLKTYLYNKLK